MFGLLISGRPIDPAPTTLSQTSYAFTISSVPSFSHIALFSLPGQDLPADAGALVYIKLPSSTEFKLLGALAARKPSAIFRISGIGGSGNGTRDGEGDVMDDETSNSTTGTTNQGQEIVIGISIEPAANVEAQLASLNPASTLNGPSAALVRSQPQQLSATASPVTTKVLAQRIIGNAFNFLASFGSDTVPLKAFQDWWTKFEKRVELDPGFLEREQG